ncbi:photosynthetic reaction center subunit H [Roseicella frigidaeris]|uniref:Photosynthetic reaction center subunit H n=1 Tax=Roseicella frigidaeris TaxID=2230885 RepID=A0A327M5I2_9PROT|nr:photosynthetic reaction center subunit H [Roseicella frigidaeris]RAI57685.1 photosynthetic reaction center subunit H [Roseicella frigidaeris]
MPSATLTNSFDVAALALYSFFLFFIGLVIYLRREDKREGYPLDSDRTTSSGGRVAVQGWPPVPQPKKYLLAHDPRPTEFERQERDLTGLLAPAAGFPGAPMQPLGDPMRDGVGPASYAERLDVPDVTFDEQLPKIVPLRAAPGYHLATEDPDPRGMTVIAADGIATGTVVEAWVDRSETFVRFLEVETAPGGRRVLLPMMLLRIDPARRLINVSSVTAAQFLAAPTPQHPDQITLREEDRITAYFASGHLYATPQRLGPLL